MSQSKQPSADTGGISSDPRYDNHVVAVGAKWLGAHGALRDDLNDARVFETERAAVLAANVLRDEGARATAICWATAHAMEKHR